MKRDVNDRKRGWSLESSCPGGVHTEPLGSRRQTAAKMLLLERPCTLTWKLNNDILDALVQAGVTRVKITGMSHAAPSGPFCGEGGGGGGGDQKMKGMHRHSPSPPLLWNILVEKNGERPGMGAHCPHQHPPPPVWIMQFVWGRCESPRLPNEWRAEVKLLTVSATNTKGIKVKQARQQKSMRSHNW